MATKPSSHADWTDGDAAKVTEPIAAKKLLGWIGDERPSFKFMNFLFFNLDAWTKWAELEIDALLAAAAGKAYDAVIAPTGTHSDFNDLMNDANIANIKRVLVAAPLTLTVTQVIDQDGMEFVFKPQAIMAKGSGLTKGFSITGSKNTFRLGTFKDFITGGDVAFQLEIGADKNYLDGAIFTNNDTDFSDLGDDNVLHAFRLDIPLPSAEIPDRSFNNQNGTTYTLAITDSVTNSNKLVTLDNVAATVVTVPPNSSVAFPIGSQIDLLRLGVGDVEMAEGADVTINSPDGDRFIANQFDFVTLIKIATDTWDLFGGVVGLITATGGNVSTDGDFKIHTFNSSGTFQITSGSGFVDSLIIAGGGGGGGSSAGGGGAGGLISVLNETKTVGSFVVTIGAGGVGGINEASGTNGSDSIFDATTAIGGGGGAARTSGAQTPPGNGGSGGAGAGSVTGPLPGGSGTGGQGNDGGEGITSGANDAGGGGGGATAVGANAADGVGGNGGIGTVNAITGASVTYAGGGGGGALAGAAGTGGDGGGGNGNTAGDGSPGVANTGGGGGGGGATVDDGGLGGSGVVIVRYKFQ